MLVKTRKARINSVPYHLWEIPDLRKDGRSIPTDTIYLNLGCGGMEREGWINCDMTHSEPRDEKIGCAKLNLLLDLNSPLPFKDGSVDEIAMDRVIGHIKHPRKIMKEIDRILKPGGQAVITPCDCPNRINRYKGGHFEKT